MAAEQLKWQLSSSAGASSAAKLMPRWQLSSQADAKISSLPSRARPTAVTGSLSPGCRESLKSMTLAPWHQEVQISRKHIIYYTSAMISWCRDHQNIDVLGPKITNKAAKQLSWCHWRGNGWAKQLSWCQNSG